MELKDLLPVALAIAVAGVGISIGVELTESMEARGSVDIPANVTNESWAPATNSSFALSQQNLTDFGAVENVSGSYYIDPANYSVNLVDGTVRLLDTSTYNSTNLNISSFKYDTLVDNHTAGADISANATAGLVEIGSWFDTIGLVLAAGIVLGVLMAAFYFSKR